MEEKRKLLQRRKFLGLIGASSTAIFLPEKSIANIPKNKISELLGHDQDILVSDKIIESLDNADIYVSPKEERLANFLLNEKFKRFSIVAHKGDKALFMYNIHTGEFFNEIIWSEGKYVKEHLSKLNYFMRDFREDKTKRIDLKAIEAIYKVSQHTKKGRPLILNSAYRTPKTNKKIGGAKHSQHKLGKAIDFSLDKKDHTSLFALKRFLVNNHNGGVGYYPRSNFIHIDAGNKRYWRG